MEKNEIVNERYVVVENPQENLENFAADLVDLLLEEDGESISLLPFDERAKALAECMKLGPDTKRWIDFQIANLNECCIWDLETGEMFTGEVPVK